MVKKLSVLLYFDTNETEFVEKSVGSILKESGMMAGELEVFLLDPSGEVQQTCAASIKVYPDSIQVVDVQGKSMAEAYNAGLEQAEGEFVAFHLTSAYYPAKALEGLGGDLYGEQKLISLKPVCKNIHNTKANLHYSFVPRKGGALDASKDMEDMQTSLHAYLIRRSLIEEAMPLRFRPEYREECIYHFLMELLIRSEGKFYYDSMRSYCYTEAMEEDRYFYGLPEKRWWYEESVQNFLMSYIEELETRMNGAVPNYLQSFIYYLLTVKFWHNLSGFDKLLLNGEEVEKFYDLAAELMLHIDNKVIFLHTELADNENDTTRVKIPRALRLYLAEKKAAKMNCHTEINAQKEKVTCCFVNDFGEIVVPQELIGNLNKESFSISVINYKNGNLEFDGYFKGGAFLDFKKIEVFARVEGNNSRAAQQFPAQRTEVYSVLKCFGKKYAQKYQIRFEIPVEELLKPGRKLTFYIQYEKSRYPLNLEFKNMHSRLLTYSQKAYWRFNDNKYILYRTNRSLYVEKSTWLKLLKHELLLDAVLMIQKDKKEARECASHRLLYWLMKPVYGRKRIWVTFDKLYKAGDNGEYFFQYCQTLDDKIDCYYVINKDAPDAKRLVAQHKDKILFANTWKQRLICLYAEAVMSTHAGVGAYLSFPGPLQKYFKDLFQMKNVCIQHGLSIQQIASFQNRLYANTELYCLASPLEYENVAKPIYGYSEDMLKMTGLARYDGLRDKKMRQILITPTWRKNIVHTVGVGLKNVHSNSFKDSAYYRIYNSLINDEKLIQTAIETGYKVVFLLHPAMSAQIDDYDRNDYVELLQATGDTSYEQILTESSLMVTDYSGVQYDFAYQRKPILYYHPEDLPPHYEEGGLNYETEGFGPICTTHEQIIEKLCESMRSNCRMEAEYKARADRFFAFDDFENCARIYKEVRKITDKK